MSSLGVFLKPIKFLLSHYFSLYLFSVEDLVLIKHSTRCICSAGLDSAESEMLYVRAHNTALDKFYNKLINY